MVSSIDNVETKLKFLKQFSACDISDALLKVVKVDASTAPRGGFLADLAPFPSPSPKSKPTSPIIAPAYTLKFASKIPSSSPEHPSLLNQHTLSPEQTFPEDTGHWVDLTPANHVVVIEQPAGQTCAVLGGIMAARMKYLGVKGVVVSGRVRDQSELGEIGLPIYARAKSTVGTAAEAKILARDVPITVGHVVVNSGDYVFIDPNEEAVVVIPQSKLDELVELVPKLVQADELVMQDVKQGISVAEAFAKHRGKL